MPPPCSTSGKNVFQAEADAACELIDFFNFNVQYLYGIYDQYQPDSSPNAWNMIECRPLEGFVFAVTPFNFTAIAGNLPTAPAMVGNTVVWKPASSAVYNAYHLMLLYKEAGLPDGVINFVPGPGSVVGPMVMGDPNLAGIHFTGSTPVFQNMWSFVGSRIAQYKTYPRIVGETGGKDFIVVHESADVDALVTGIIRGAFEYQGQKCSAASRVYIPRSLWPAIKEKYVAEVETIKMGDVRDFSNFMNAVIDRAAFDKIKGYIQTVQASDEAEIITGGTWNDEKGYFISPTTVVTSNPKFKTMVEEIFGPVVTFYIYDEPYEDILYLCDETGPYGLTGSVYATDRKAILRATKILTHAAGNFLHQRQTHRRGGGPAAIRRRPGLGHQRQGRLAVEPAEMDLPARHQGKPASAHGLQVSLHGILIRAVLSSRPRPTGNFLPDGAGRSLFLT